MKILYIFFILFFVLYFYFYYEYHYNYEKYLKRGSGSHINKDGTPKIGYLTKDDADIASLLYKLNTGEDMNTYQCLKNPQEWHIGHRSYKTQKST